MRKTIVILAITAGLVTLESCGGGAANGSGSAQKATPGSGATGNGDGTGNTTGEGQSSGVTGASAAGKTGGENTTNIQHQPQSNR